MAFIFPKHRHLIPLGKMSGCSRQTPSASQNLVPNGFGRMVPTSGKEPGNFEPKDRQPPPVLIPIMFDPHRPPADICATPLAGGPGINRVIEDQPIGLGEARQ